MLDYNKKGIFNLISATVAHCFTNYRLSFPFKKSIGEIETILQMNKKIISDTSAIRFKFSNSPLLQMFCDCSDSFEFTKVRKEIIKYQLVEISRCNCIIQEYLENRYKQTQYGKANIGVK